MKSPWCPKLSLRWIAFVMVRNAVLVYCKRGSQLSDASYSSIPPRGYCDGCI